MIKKYKTGRLPFLLFAISVGLAGMCTYQLDPAATDKINFLRYDIDIVNKKGLLVFAVFAVLAFAIIYFVERYGKKVSVLSRQSVNERSVFLKTFIACLLVWGGLFLLYFPGTGMNDTINSFALFWFYTFQPAIFQLLVYGTFHSIYFLCKNANIAYAIIVIIQILTASYIVSNYLRWLVKKGLKKWLLVINAICIIAMPLIGNYTLAVLKDTWFTLALFLLLPNIYDLLHGEKANWLQIVGAIFFVWFSRSNGKLVLIPVLIVLLLICKKERKHLAILLGSFLIFNGYVNHMQMVHFGYDESFRESMSVPLSQMAATIVWNGDISSDEAEILYSILPEEEWKKSYSFSFVDTIKFNEQFDNFYLNAHKKEFLQTWASMLKKNFTIYVKAYLYQTYGNWSLAAYNTDAVDKTQSIFLRINNNTGEDSSEAKYLESISLKNHSLLPNDVTELLQELYEDACEWNLWLTPGIMFSLLNLCTCIAWKNRRYRLILTFLPLYLCWGCMMVASPASMIYRYSFYLLLSLPFVLTMTWRDIGVIEKRTEEKAYSS